MSSVSEGHSSTTSTTIETTWTPAERILLNRELVTKCILHIPPWWYHTPPQKRGHSHPKIGQVLVGV